jgi:hypothetical protein
MGPLHKLIVFRWVPVILLRPFIIWEPVSALRQMVDE